MSGIDIAAALAEAERAVPGVSGMPVRYLAQGWDAATYRVGDDPVLRVTLKPSEASTSRATHVAEATRGVVALGFGIPAPLYVGRGWSLAPWVEGVVAADAGIDLNTLAPDLAAVCRALHHPAPADAPRNPWRGVPLTERTEAQGENLAVIRDLAPDLAPRLEAAWRAGLEAPAYDGPPVWVHGDLHPGNLLVNAPGHARAGRLAGVIDWEDLTAGDPAVDWGIAWLAFDEGVRREFFAAVGADAAGVQRARGNAVAVVNALIRYADRADYGAMLPGLVARVAG